MNKSGIAIQGSIFDNIKKWDTDAWYNMDQPWKHDAKKLITKDHIL